MSVHTINISTLGNPVVGQTYSLICSGRIFGNISLLPLVYWRNRTGGALKGNNLIITNGNLTFFGLKAYNGGQYMCLSILISSNSTAMLQANVTVHSEL